MWGKSKKKSKKSKNVSKFSFSSKSKSYGKNKGKCKCNQTKKAKKKSNYTVKKGGYRYKQIHKKRIQQGKGKYLTAVPSEYYNTKNRVSYILEDGISKLQGQVRPIDPSPIYQNYQVSKFDISPPISLIQK